MHHTSYVDYILDTLQSFGNIRLKKMFGSYGLYKDTIFFAIISDDTLYFKVGHGDQHFYEKHGSKPFTYTKKNGQSINLSYWEVPADILENREKLALWIERSLCAAQQIK